MTSNLASEQIAEHGLELRRAQEAADREQNEVAAISVSREFKDHVVRPILKVKALWSDRCKTLLQLFTDRLYGVPTQEQGTKKHRHKTTHREKVHPFLSPNQIEICVLA